VKKESYLANVDSMNSVQYYHNSSISLDNQHIESVGELRKHWAVIDFSCF